MGLGASCKSWPKRLCDSETNTGGGEVDTQTMSHNRTMRDMKKKLLYKEQEDELDNSDDDEEYIENDTMDGVPDTGSPMAHKDAKRALYTLGLDGNTMRTIMDIGVPDPAPIPSFDISDHMMSTEITSQSTLDSTRSTKSTPHSQELMMQYPRHSLPLDATSTINSIHSVHSLPDPHGHAFSDSEHLHAVHHHQTHQTVQSVPITVQPFQPYPDDMPFDEEFREMSPMASSLGMGMGSHMGSQRGSVEPSPEFQAPPDSATGSTDSDGERFDHFDSTFGPLSGPLSSPLAGGSMLPLGSMTMPLLPGVRGLPEKGTRSVGCNVAQRGRSNSNDFPKRQKSNLLRPKSTAMWADNDIDELHEEMSNQLQHLVTHSMSLDGSAGALAPFTTYLKSINSVDSEATDSAEDEVNDMVNSKQAQNVKDLKVTLGSRQSRGHQSAHSYSHSAGRIEDIVAAHTHTPGAGRIGGTETPKNLCSPQTADQWDDEDLDRQAEAIRMRLEQYRMDRE